MPEYFNCPSCGAGLQYNNTGAGRTMKCPYCGTTVQVPEEFWQPVEQAQTASQWKRYLVLFLALTVGLPTCLGLLGAVLGIGGSILGVIIPVILSIFVH